jgi:hypothetical protein
MATGVTVNISPEGERARLQVWVAGKPKVNEVHDTVLDCGKRFLAIVLAGTLGSTIGREAGRVVGDLMRDAFGGKAGR